MAINLDCPRCKAHLRVPNKKAGGYVNCPHCQGRLWVDKAAATDATPAEAVTMSAPPAAPPPAPPPYVAAEVSSPPGVPLRTAAAPVPARSAVSPAAMPALPPTSTPPPAPKLPPMRSSAPAPAVVPAMPPSKPSPPKTTPAAANSAPPAPPLAPPVVLHPHRKVARFISADAAQSTLQLAADGKLPELHLSDGGQKDEQEKKSSSISPWMLYGVVAISVLLSAAIFLLGDSSTTGNAEGRANAWREIEANYFVDPAGNELKPYNRLLREAKRAQQSQDRKTQRELFGRVLDQLRAERGVNEKGLTGSRERDKKLEEQITVLLNGLKQE